jgi:hypothetical protein
LANEIKQLLRSISNVIAALGITAIKGELGFLRYFIFKKNLGKTVTERTTGESI